MRFRALDHRGETAMRNDLTIYDKVADQWWSDDVRWIRTLKNLVPGRLKWMDRQIDWAGKRVLDLGCAGGFMAEALAERGAVVTGIDPAEDAVAVARTHASQTGKNIRYDIGVGEALPYEDGHYDAVVCVDVLEHVADLDQTVREISRVLTPGGLFLFDTINRNPIARLATITMAEDILRLLPRGTHDPDMYIKPAELRGIMADAGLEPGPMTGLGPRGINRRFDITFGPLPMKTILYMGKAQK
jgi:2-polyprenyl-6-hydroxyphenyl methylase/3-demethylubiquinone-9 3-methyltransferase